VAQEFTARHDGSRITGRDCGAAGASQNGVIGFPAAARDMSAETCTWMMNQRTIDFPVEKY
jgi:hypothetical protein